MLKTFVTGVQPDENGDYMIGDMILSKAQILSYLGLSDINATSFTSEGINGHYFRWPHREMPYRIHPSIKGRELDNVRKAIKEFNEIMYGCLRIV